MTRSSPIRARSPIRASVIPSAKYSCAGSPERFSSGRTAIEATAGCGGRPFSRTSNAYARAARDQRQQRVERLRGERHRLAVAQQAALHGVESERAELVEVFLLAGH